MKIIVTGSTGNISKPLTSLLVNACYDVSVITTSSKRTAEIESLGAEALLGSVEDADFVKEAFKDANAAYTMIPPNMAAEDWKKYIYGVGDNYVQAIKGSGIKKVVNLSSTGAHLPEGGGLSSLYYHVEQEFNKLDDVDVVHLRPALFYPNFYGNIDMIKHMHVIGNNYTADLMPLVHPADIAAAAFEEFSALNFKGKRVRYVASDELSTDGIAQVLGEAIGNPELPWIKFNDEDALKGIMQAGGSPDVAKKLVEMGQGVEKKYGLSDYFENRPVLSSHKFKDFAKEFAAAYLNSK